MTSFDSIDFSALEEADFSVGAKQNETERMNYLGGGKQTWPIDVRILVNMINKDEARPMIETHIHEYIVNDQYVRIPCARAAGLVCAICDAHWDHKGQSDKLAARGGNAEGSADHVEWKKHSALAKQFEQKKRFSMLAVLKGDTKVSILEAKTQLTKEIFGDKYKDKAGAVAEIKSYGVPVYNPSEPTGWLTLNKTGTGLATTYTAKPALITKIVGKKKEEQLVEEPVHPLILEKFQDMSKLPALSKSFKEKLWSPEEMENYVASAGTELPSRVAEYLAKWSKKKTGAPGADAAEAKPASVSTANFDMFDAF